jgi:site-specific recombinase XerD
MKKPVKLTLDTVTSNTLRDIEDFMRNEHKIFVEFPDIYTEIPEKRTPQMRGQNTINDIFTKLRTFFLWAIEVGKTTNNPFKGYAVEECVYGTPYYISIDERNQLYQADLSKRPRILVAIYGANARKYCRIRRCNFNASNHLESFWTR